MNTRRFAARTGLTAAAALFAAVGFAGQAYAASPADGSGTAIAVTGTVPGTNTLCSSYWGWNVHSGAGGWSEVEWVSNPCNFSIEDRSWCEDPSGAAEWATSGIVRRVNLWDRATCGSSDTIHIAEVRFLTGTGWGSWQTYWTS